MLLLHCHWWNPPIHPQNSWQPACHQRLWEGADTERLPCCRCEKCQRLKRLQKTPAVLHPMPHPDTSFTQFDMDLIGPLKDSKNGNRYIIVLTDYLAKWPEAEAIPSKQASEIAKLMTKIISRYISINLPPVEMQEALPIAADTPCCKGRTGSVLTRSHTGRKRRHTRWCWRPTCYQEMSPLLTKQNHRGSNHFRSPRFKRMPC